MIADMVVVADEVSYFLFKIAGHIIVLEQDPVLESLMPSLDFTLGLRMHGRTPGVVHAFVTQPVCQLCRDVA